MGPVSQKLALIVLVTCVVGLAAAGIVGGLMKLTTG